MSDFDVNNLLHALENNENESILSKNLTSEKIDIIKNNVFDDIGIDDETRDDFKKKLQNYIYIDGMNDLIPGSYIRWIPLQNPDNIHLTRGGNICDINICEKGTTVVVKNLRNNYMQICLDNCLIFRKLNNQEMILISAMNYLQNN